MDVSPAVEGQQQVLTPEDAEVHFNVGRRIFLGMAALTAAGVLWGVKAEHLMERFAGGWGSGISSLLPVGRFRIYSVTGALPDKAPADWRMKVEGLVDRPMTVTFEQLLAMPSVSFTKDFQCVTGWRVKDVAWKGVKLSHILAQAGVKPGADALSFTSFDGTYTESLTVGQARRDDVILAYEIDGKSVSRSQGGPVRLYVAPMYGYKSLKWLQDIIVVGEVEPGYWEERGYEIDAWVGRSNGRDDRPT